MPRFTRPAADPDTAVAAVRQYFGLSQEEMAGWLGSSKALSGHLETGRRTLNPEAAAALAPLVAALPPPNSPVAHATPGERGPGYPRAGAGPARSGPPRSAPRLLPAPCPPPAPVAAPPGGRGRVGRSLGGRPPRPARRPTPRPRPPRGARPHRRLAGLAHLVPAPLAWPPRHRAAPRP